MAKELDTGLLTDRQLEVYLYILSHHWATGKTPTLREICKHMGIKTTNGVACHIEAIQRKGFLVGKSGASTTRSFIPVGVSWLPVASEDAAEAARVLAEKFGGRTAQLLEILASNEGEKVNHTGEDSRE